MKIRTRITLFYTLLTASLLIAFGVFIYLSASKNRAEEFYNVLVNEAITKANLFLNAKIEETTLQKIYISNREWIDEVEVAIYKPPFELQYHDAVEIDFVQETPEMIAKILEKGELRFYQDEWQVIGIRYIVNEQPYIIVAAALDTYGYNKLASLRQNILLLLLISTVLVFLFGILLANKAFNPVKEMIRQAKQISANNLNLRLSNPRNKDELHDLSNTFNALLDRLETSFDAQKDFVSNIAHEIRTPLAAIIGELELTLVHHQEDSALKNALESTLNDAKRLSKIATNLLDLAKANYDAQNISFKPTRIDELLLDACHDVQKMNACYKTEINYSIDDLDETILTKNANTYLLKIAFINIIENACKYSENNTCAITLNHSHQKLILTFQDNGPGISDEELEFITTPFYRGKNQTKAKGAGIGLSLTKRILELHAIQFNISSKKGEGTTVSVLF